MENEKKMRKRWADIYNLHLKLIVNQVKTNQPLWQTQVRRTSVFYLTSSAYFLWSVWDNCKNWWTRKGWCFNCSFQISPGFPVKDARYPNRIRNSKSCHSPQCIDRFLVIKSFQNDLNCSPWKIHMIFFSNN